MDHLKISQNNNIEQQRLAVILAGIPSRKISMKNQAAVGVASKLQRSYDVEGLILPTSPISRPTKLRCRVAKMQLKGA